MATKNSKRVKYGFALDFPTTEFTLRDLRNMKSRKVQYITLYKRVRTALLEGVIVVSGKRQPKNVRKGRMELTYKRAVEASNESAVA